MIETKQIEVEKKYIPSTHETGVTEVKIVTFEYELDKNGNRKELKSRKISNEIYDPSSKHYGLTDPNDKSFDASFKSLLDKFHPQQEQDNIRLISEKESEIEQHIKDKDSLGELNNTLVLRFEEEKSKRIVAESELSELKKVSINQIKK